MGYKVSSNSPGVSRQKFYLNVVGYKAAKGFGECGGPATFYLNVVGYKVAFFVISILLDSTFYLNVVGYKGFFRIYSAIFINRVLSERSGI